MVYDSFAHWVEAEVIPLQQSQQTWHRLDGWDAGGNRKVFARFRHAGQVWAVHSDTRFRPVMAAYRAVCEEGRPEPFNVEPTKAGQCLTLRPDLWDTDLPKHFYVYSQTQ